MPKVEDIFSKLNSAKYLSTLDIQAGYHHIPPDEDLISKTAFMSPFGKHEYLKVPFGLAQAPAYFKELMNKVLKDLPFAIVLGHNHRYMINSSDIMISQCVEAKQLSYPPKQSQR